MALRRRARILRQLRPARSPCAGGQPGSDGQRCPYTEHRPLTEAGWQAWDVLTRCAGQLRLAGTAVVGLDLTAALMLADALGHDARAVAELLSAAEAGLVKKSGTWYTYGETKLGQGKENARAHMLENPDLTLELENKIREMHGLKKLSPPKAKKKPEAEKKEAAEKGHEELELKLEGSS